MSDTASRTRKPARGPMAKFYKLLDGTRRQPLSDDLVGRMYRLLDEARGLTHDDAASVPSVRLLRVHGTEEELLAALLYESSAVSEEDALRAGMSADIFFPNVK